MTFVAREQCRTERERREESGRKLKDIYSLLTNKERAIDRLEKQLNKCQLDLTELTQEANQEVSRAAEADLRAGTAVGLTTEHTPDGSRRQLQKYSW